MGKKVGAIYTLYNRKLIFFQMFLKKKRFQSFTTTILVGGESFMSEFIWHWTKGNKKIYTTQIEQAEQALKEGFFVMGSRLKPDSC
jgi:hypothetical protein